METKRAASTVQIKNGHIIDGILNATNFRDSADDISIPGCFANTVKTRPKVPACANHEIANVIGSAHLRETARGLEVTCYLAKDVQRAAEIHALLMLAREVGHEHLLNWSMGYNVIRSRKGKNGVRELLEVEVLEASIVTFPCNVLSVVTDVRSHQPAKLDETLRRIRNLRMLITSAKDREDAEALGRTLKQFDTSKLGALLAQLGK